MLKLAQPPDIPAAPAPPAAPVTIDLAVLRVFYEAGRADERAACGGT